MVAKYKVVHWMFDAERFGRHVTAWIETVGAEAIAEVMDVTVYTVRCWGKGEVVGAFNHPRMSNFIKLCDELSLDPRDFFTTTE